MIKTTILYEQEQIKEFEISGHAESGPYGYDLVCAGVSAISFGTINAILSLCEIDLHIQQAEDGGYLHVTVPEGLSEQTNEEVQLLLKAMIVSLQTIEREYSEFITIIEK